MSSESLFKIIDNYFHEILKLLKRFITILQLYNENTFRFNHKYFNHKDYKKKLKKRNYKNIYKIKKYRKIFKKSSLQKNRR